MFTKFLFDIVLTINRHRADIYKISPISAWLASLGGSYDYQKIFSAEIAALLFQGKQGTLTPCYFYVGPPS